MNYELGTIYQSPTSSITFYALRFTFYASHIMHHALHIIFYVLRITFCILHSAFCILPSPPHPFTPSPCHLVTPRSHSGQALSPCHLVSLSAVRFRGPSLFGPPGRGARAAPAPGS